ncbi:MAG: choline-sulfatase [Hyphomicrobiales bacterium]|nr:choline-sulfatase [Hyphomicrobiales bacterium]
MSGERPNVLIVMADQLSAPRLRAYGHRVVKTPNLDRLAAAGVVFENAYCNFPLCSPSRASFMSGQLASRTRVYDNAAEFSADVPTFAHYMRAAGWRVALAGKMHFCGPDQMHGFEERLTTDIYPADYGWTPDWERPQDRPEWYHNMSSVREAGVCVRTNQIDFDEETAFAAERALHDWARSRDRRPFCLVASFTHPHDPFAITEEYWNLHRDDEIDMPRHAGPPDEGHDPHSARVRRVCATDSEPVSEAEVRAARRAYYGEIAYVDRNLGRLTAALEATGFAKDAIVIFTADHGEMLGERGLWYKMSFFEGSARVPLIVGAPGRFPPRRVAAPVSLVDLAPTLADFAGVDPVAGAAAPFDGRSLRPWLEGREGPSGVAAEYLAEGAIAPVVMLREGDWKFVHCPADPDLLFDVAGDPDERTNRAADPACADVIARFRAEAAKRWDLRRIDAEVRASQRRRRTVDAALKQGRRHAWDHQPFRDASQEYVRSHMPLDDVEAMARFPRVTKPAT